MREFEDRVARGIIGSRKKAREEKSKRGYRRLHLGLS
jgi:hypothetical protein